MPIYIKNSWRKDKRYVALIDKFAVHFGQQNAENYTIHKNPIRKQRYILRHSATGLEDWSNPLKPAYWSRWLLWHKPSLKDSAKDIEKMLGTKVVLLI